MELTLYSHPNTRARRVRWVLEELELAYREEAVDIFSAEDNTAYRAIHPLGQVPALRINDDVMIESGAIVQWLADSHLDKGLAPALDAPQRREFDQWMFFSVTTLEGPAWEIALHGKLLPKELRVKAIVPFALRRLREVLAVLEGVMAGRDYLVDNRFSVADVMIGDVLMWFPDQLTAYSALQGYVERLSQRPAWQRSRQDRSPDSPI